MANEPNILKEYSININDYNPHAFCLIRVELDEAGKPCDWTFLYCNDALAKLEGLPKEKILGHRFFELFPNGSRKWLKRYYESAYEGKMSSCNDISEEIDKYLQIESFPTNEKGVCVCVLRDIKAETVEKLQRDKELQQTVEKLEAEKRINAQVRQYASAMGMVYPLAIYVDYLNNGYHMLEYEQFLNKTAKWSGTVDELIDVGASTIPDREYADKFKALFGREKALEAFRSGEQELTLKHPQYGDDGKVHWMETKVICLECTDTKAEAISVSKCIDEEKQIEDAKEKLQERDFILTALSTDYDEVYFCDIDADTLRVIKSGDLAAIDSEGKYSEIGRFFFKDKVLVESAPDMLEKLSRNGLKNYLSSHRELSIRYELKADEQGRRFCETRFVHVPSDAGFFVVIGTHFIDEIILEHLHQEAETRKHYQIINALGNEYSPLYLVDTNTKHWEILNTENFDKINAAMDGNVRYDDFDVALDRFIDQFVVEENREYLHEHMKLEKILEATPDVGINSLNYDRMQDGVKHHWQLNSAKFTADDGKTYLVLGFRNVHDIVEERLAQQKKEREKEAAHQREIEEHLREEKEHSEVIDSLSTIYSTIFKADIDTHEYEILASIPLMAKVAPTTGNFDDVKEVIIENFMESEFRESLSEFLDLNTLSDRLEKVNTVTVDYKAPTGQWMQARFIAKRRDENGRAVETLYVAREITEEKNRDIQQQEVLTQALAMAQQANKAKTTFLNSMSHDIRTPMNAIVGFTALAQTHIDDQSQVQDYLSKIGTSSTHLLSLINDILDMSRIESGTVKLDEKAVHMPDLLHDLRTMIQGQVNAKNQNLFIDTQDVVHEDVLTDKLRLNQVLLNIVSNAVKFTQPGGDIIIRLVEKPCSLKHYITYEFSVKDNGIGMSKEFLGHIFETFTREYSATVSGIQGTGLGMAITKNIVDMMGGDIRVESEEGKGSLFTVTLNLRLAGEPVKYEPIPELLGARALIVDDDTNSCLSVSKMLRDIEMRPDWTVSGKEAIIRAQEAAEMKDEYKVYIIDYLMPDMNGIETVRRIRKVISEDVPIIVLTAYDWADFENEAREAGVTAFVSKPIFMSELRAVLTQPVGGEDTLSKEEKKKKNYEYSGKHILLVEDNELNREIATAILEETGMTIDSVEDGDVAVATINREPADKYDLILMDIQMPKMDGYTATREIRTLPDNKKANIPIVAMTANAFDEDRKKAFEAGMNGHIIKPINMDEIASVLDEIFERKK